MKAWYAAGLLAGVLTVNPLVNPTSAWAQRPDQEPSMAEWDPLFEFGPLGSVRNMRPSEMPVVPIFDGWINNGDGTADLCFGYKSLNLEERLDIPLGSDNYMEPARFDGMQPTFFLETPPGRETWGMDVRAAHIMRHYCVFSVTVPMDSDPVYWTLKRHGFEYTTLGHTGSRSYLLDDTWNDNNRGPDAAGGKMAPLVEWVEPQGSAHIGRAGEGARAGPVTGRVGVPITLSIAVTQPPIEEYEGDPKPWNVFWYKYQGPPGEVRFSETATRLVQGDMLETKMATTSATFLEPGRYVVQSQVLMSAFQSQCCWTNAYVEVDIVE
jgi:hypothetical protein